MQNQTAGTKQLPHLGLGLRLRHEYVLPVLENPSTVDWFEIISECYLEATTEQLHQLDKLREKHPIVMHGISLGIGSPWPLDQRYLNKLKKLINRIQPAWISDHLCWDGADDAQGQLLPVPHSEEMLEHIIPRVRQVQDYLDSEILLENVPLESIHPKSDMGDAEFVSAVAAGSNSKILLDIGNLHTSSSNQSSDPATYISQLPADKVQQIHLTGATILCDESGDTGMEPPDPVWQLFLQAQERFGPTATMIERLDTIPSLEEMTREIEKARCALKNRFPEWQTL